MSHQDVIICAHSLNGPLARLTRTDEAHHCYPPPNCYCHCTPVLLPWAYYNWRLHHSDDSELMACLGCGKTGLELRWGFCRDCRPDLHKPDAALFGSVAGRVLIRGKVRAGNTFQKLNQT